MFTGHQVWFLLPADQTIAPNKENNITFDSRNILGVFNVSRARQGYNFLY